LCCFCDTKHRQVGILSSEGAQQQIGLAELALEHYGAAATAFQSDYEARRRASKRLEEKAAGEHLREAIEVAQQAAKAYWLNDQYHLATAVLNETLDDAAEKHSFYPEDMELHQIWVGALFSAKSACIGEK
jgi:type II secretory pathway pseudopilin PulG